MHYKFGLGSFRFILAVFVTFSHLNHNMIHGVAAYAVWGFYLLSGYLMTLILNEKYGFNSHGIYFFARSRFLRIYPAYYAALLLGVFTILIFNNLGTQTHQFNPEFFLPQTFAGWLQVFTLFPFLPYSGLPVPTAHALSLEIGMYILSPIICRNKYATSTCLLLSFLSNWNIGFEVSTFPERYSTFIPSLLAFSLGSLVYQYRDNFKQLRMPFLSVFLWLIYSCTWLFFPSWPWSYGLYFSLLFSGWVVISLIDVQSKLDNILGDFSYPIYLVHVTTAAVAGFVFKFSVGSWLYCMSGVFFTLLISHGIIIYIENPMRRRKLIKTK